MSIAILLLLLPMAFGAPMSESRTLMVDCRGLLGFVRNPLDACSNFYYNCNADGIGQVVHCHSKTLVFDFRTDACVDPDALDECVPPALDCSQLSPGNYPNPMFPCSSFYFTCIPGGKHIKQPCADQQNTKYDVATDSCMFPEYVEACGGKPTSATTKATKATTVKTTTTTQATPVEFDCRGRSVGNHQNPEQPCSSTFFSCTVAGKAVKQRCAHPDTRYDKSTDSCLFPQFVKQCPGTPATTKATTTQTTTKATTTQAAVNFCTGRAVGNHKNPMEPCSSGFFACTEAGIPVAHKCADPGTRYDEVSDACLYPEYVESCGGTATTTKTTPTVDFDCQGREVGNHRNPREPCSNTFIACTTAGMAVLRRCAHPDTRYDMDTDSCLFPESVKECGKTTASTTRQTTTERTTKATTTQSAAVGFCTGRVVGNHKNPKEPCSSGFFACTEAGIPVAQKCADPGTKYDEVSDACLYPEYVESCGGTATTTKITPTATVDFECLGQEIGNHRNPKQPCSNTFIACTTAGMAILRRCAHPDTRYDMDTDSCLFPGSVKECGVTTTESTTTSTTTKATTTTASTTTKVTPSEPVDFDCSGRAIGNHQNPKEPCSSTFFSCNHAGMAVEHRCAHPDTRYDKLTDSCLFPQFVKQCGGTPATTERTTTQSTTKATTTQPAAVGFCTGRAVGNHKNPMEPCSSGFFACTEAGIPVEQKCADPGTKYDEVSDACLYPEYVESCGGTATTTKTTPTATVDFECLGREVGNHRNPSQPCSNTFIACTTAGMAVLRRCAQPDTRYDMDTDSCLFPESVKECGVTTDTTEKTTTPTTTKATTTTTAKPSEPGVQLKNVPTAVADPEFFLVDFDCSGRAIGNHQNPKEPCSSSFFSCNHAGMAVEHRCAHPNTRYDKLTDSCLFPQFVKQCGGTPATTKRTTTQSTTKATTTKPAAVGFCTGRAVGNHKNPMEPCSSGFFACTEAGIPVEQKCADPGTKYDEVSDACLYPEYVESCGGTATTTKTTPTATVDFECFGREVGNHRNPKQPCSNTFIACTTAGMAVLRRCAHPDTRYDMDTDSCLFPESVKECGGTTATTTKATTTTAATTTKVTPSEPVDFDCSGRAIGNHQNPKEPCSSTFFTCNHAGMAFEHKCAHPDTKYDKSTDSCLFAHMVEQCGGTTERTTTSTTTKATTTTAATTTKVTPSEPVDFDCSGRAIGNHQNPKEPCSSSFFTCNHAGMAFEHRCAHPDTKYDKLTDSCLYPKFVKQCGGTTATTQQTTRATTTRPAAVGFCTGRAVGNHKNPMEPCSSGFFACTEAGIPVEQKCADPGTKYDEVSDACLYPEYVESCGGTATTTKSTPTATVDFDCLAREVGNHRNPKQPCSNTFIACTTAGMAVLRRCAHPDTRYDMDTDSCLFPEAVKECGSTTTEKATTSITAAATTTKVTPSEPVEFDCHGRSVGNHQNPKQPCSSTFFACTEAGMAVKHRCAHPHTRYDKLTDSCLFPQFVKQCGGTTATTKTTTKATTTQPAAVGFDCTGRAVGNHKNPTEPCSSGFFACTKGGIAVEHKCADPSTKYDEVSDACLYPESVESCGGTATTTTTKTTPKQHAAPAISVVDFDCLAREVGNHHNPREPCSNTFIACTTGGMAVLHRCAHPDTRYDMDTDSCLFPDSVKECGGTKTTEATTVQTTTTPQATTVEFDCRGRSVGNHQNPAQPCSSTFFACTEAGMAVEHRCAHPDTRYDKRTDSCLFPQFVKQCGGTPATTKRTTTQTTTKATTTQPAAVGFDCTGRAVGNHKNPTEPCSSGFFACTKGGIAVEHKCADPGTKYDEVSDACLYPEYVESCGGTAATTKTTPTATVDFDCLGREVGNHRNPREPCSNTFIACTTAGMAVLHRCAHPDTRYDMDTDSCLFPQFVKQCGGTTATTKATTTQPAAVGFDCTGRAVGNHKNPSDPCSSGFFACTKGGIAVEHKCADPGTMYDEVSDACLYPEFVESCGGAATTTKTTPTAAVDFVCVGRVVGNHRNPKEPCSNTFIACTTGGLAVLRRCAQPDTRYDLDTDSCLFPGSVKACGNVF